MLKHLLSILIALTLPPMEWGLSPSFNSASFRDEILEITGSCALTAPLVWWERYSMDQHSAIMAINLLKSEEQIAKPIDRTRLLQQMSARGIQVKGAYLTPLDYVWDINELTKGVQGHRLSAIKKIILIPWFLTPFWTSFSPRYKEETGTVVIPVLWTRKSFRILAANQLGRHLADPKIGRTWFGAAIGFGLLSRLEPDAEIIRHHSFYSNLLSDYLIASPTITPSLTFSVSSTVHIWGMRALLGYGGLGLIYSNIVPWTTGILAVVPFVASISLEIWVRAWMMPSAVREFSGPSLETVKETHRFRFSMAHTGSRLILAILLGLFITDDLRDDQPRFFFSPILRMWNRIQALTTTVRHIGEEAKPRLPQFEITRLIWPSTPSENDAESPQRPEDSTFISNWTQEYFRWQVSPSGAANNLGPVIDPFVLSPDTSLINHLNSSLTVSISAERAKHLKAFHLVFSRTETSGHVGFLINSSEKSTQRDLPFLSANAKMTGKPMRLAVDVPAAWRNSVSEGELSISIFVYSGNELMGFGENLPLIGTRAPFFKLKGVDVVFDDAKPNTTQRVAASVLGSSS